ncbi:hypothetical protein CG405_04140, partial [Gardnerella vaginalis]
MLREGCVFLRSRGLSALAPSLALKAHCAFN